MMLLNFLHLFGLVNSVQPAQVFVPFSEQQERTLHQVAFAFFPHPLHFPLRYDRHAPQYSPQQATRSEHSCTTGMFGAPFD
jgi:hypothetical protein